MAKQYFSHLPRFDYINRNPNESNVSNYVEVKNLFRRGKLREDIFQNLAFFTKYKILGDERPDNVAYKFYEDEDLDWVILLSNNILDINTEWPLQQLSFDKFILDKYGSYENAYGGIHHYETVEVTNTLGDLLLPAGLRVPENYSLVYYDSGLGQETVQTEITVPITNYEYEMKIEDNKRNIFVLKGRYLSLVFNDMEKIMTYKEGATQYISSTLKRGDNIRLYE